MSKRTKYLATISLALLLATPVVSQEATAGTVVSTVNGIDITLGHMIVLRRSLPEEYQTMPDDVLFGGILEQLVQQSVLAQNAGEPDALITLQLDNELRSLLAAVTIQELVSRSLTEESLQAAYDARFANVEPSREYNASHILVATEEEAAALVEQLNGDADFADLAKEKSTGPSGPNGGELGWFGAGMMVRPFEDEVVGMQIGQISAPVQTQFGWHVIKLNDARTRAAPTLGDVRGELIEDIQQQVVEQTLKELTAAAEIVRPDLSALDPAILRNMELVREWP